MIISPALIELLRQQFKLDWGGVHGAPHWARVRENGLRLSEITGANTKVIEAFAFIHDSQRINDGYDPLHGSRAAEFAKSLPKKILNLRDDELDLLVIACQGHSNGLMEADLTVLTCWDADRLDLGRVGIVPNPMRLCTEAARAASMIQWAYGRSTRSTTR